ncbi:hypothetical protein LOS25_17740 [Enterococcus faecium]|nr:hypothetical protein [Enterococcus faecium]
MGIYRQHGKGTFVSELRTNATDLAGAYSFTNKCGQWANIHMKPRYYPSRRLKRTKFICQSSECSTR